MMFGKINGLQITCAAAVMYIHFGVGSRSYRSFVVFRKKQSSAENIVCHLGLSVRRKYTYILHTHRPMSMCFILQ